MFLMDLALGEAEGKDADFYVACLYQFFGTGNDGGTCSYHIVDDEEMFTLDCCAIDEFEDFFHVFIAVPTTQTSLTPFEANALDYLVKQGKACGFANASCNL